MATTTPVTDTATSAAPKPDPVPPNPPDVPLPDQNLLDCNPTEAAQLYVDRANADVTYATTVETAQTALNTAAGALANAQVALEGANKTQTAQNEVTEITRFQQYQTAYQTFIGAI